MKAMIFAAGLGTRLKPLTDTMPKALVPVAGRPLLEHLILKLKSFGFGEVIVNVHHFPEQIITFIHANNSFGIRVEISDESGQLLDTGGGVKRAASFFNDSEPFLLHNVDILSNINFGDLYASHTETDAFATLAVSERETFRYLLFNNDDRLRGWTNIKTGEHKPSELINIDKYHKKAFTGIQILSPQALIKMKVYPDKFPIMDFYLNNVSEERIMAYSPSNLKILDVGKIDVIDAAANFLKTLQ